MDEKKKESLTEKIKEGVSVQELEHFARKHTTEVFLILAILIATISSAFDFFTGPVLSVLFAGLGAIASIAFPEKIHALKMKVAKFVFKKDKGMQITIGIVRIAVALFIPFILFAILGVLAGEEIHRLIRESEKEKPKEEEHI